MLHYGVPPGHQRPRLTACRDPLHFTRSTLVSETMSTFTLACSLSYFSEVVAARLRPQLLLCYFADTFFPVGLVCMPNNTLEASTVRKCEQHNQIAPVATARTTHSHALLKSCGSDKRLASFRNAGFVPERCRRCRSVWNRQISLESKLADTQDRGFEHLPAVTTKIFVEDHHPVRGLLRVDVRGRHSI